MAGTVRILVGNRRSKLMGDFSLDVVDKATSCYKTGYRFMTRYKKQQWDGKMHLLSVQTNMLPTGVVPAAIAALKKEGHPVEIEFAAEAEVLEPIREPRAQYDDLTPRDYQHEAAESVVRGGLIGQKGLLRLPTGSGKTLVIAIIADVFGEITIVLVHGKQLVDQTRRELARFLDEPVGIVMGDELEWERVTVVSVDSAASRLKRKDPDLLEFLKATKVLIADEAHRVGGGQQTFHKVMDACQAPVRIGMSGTPFKKTIDSDLLLMSRTGPLLYDLTSAQLQDEGYLSRADLQIFEFTDPADGQELAYRDAVDELVIENIPRTEFIAEQAHNLIRHGGRRSVLIVAGNSVVLTKALKRAWEGVEDRLHDVRADVPFPKTTFVTGSSGRKKVNAAVEDLREGRIQLLCSTVLFDEGTDIPALDALILAWPTKSFVKVMQRIGRGLRPKGPDDKLLVIDLFDNTNPYLVKHFYKRLTFYEKESLFDTVEIEQVPLDGFAEERYNRRSGEAQELEPGETCQREIPKT